MLVSSWGRVWKLFERITESKSNKAGGPFASKVHLRDGQFPLASHTALLISIETASRDLQNQFWKVEKAKGPMQGSCCQADLGTGSFHYPNPHLVPTSCSSLLVASHLSSQEAQLWKETLSSILPTADEGHFRKPPSGKSEPHKCSVLIVQNISFFLKALWAGCYVAQRNPVAQGSLASKSLALESWWRRKKST